MADDHELIGEGGGIGRYRGISVREVQDRFEACVAAPSMRSLSAVLCLTREQLEARGHLGAYPQLAIGGAVLSVLLGVAYPFLPKEGSTTLIAMVAGVPIVTLMVTIGALTSRHARRAALAQEREIRRLAVDALERLSAHGFPRKPLTREQIDTVRTLLRTAPQSAALKDLL